ncbi:MAG: radical SAM protein [Bacteroidota bacterium]|nr:radical SAM protein [Bacteroidota bacterium]
MDFKTSLTEVFIETTNFCNLNCVFCPHDQIVREKEIMPFEDVIRLLDELEQDFVFDWISFHLYGEPLIHPDFMRIVENAAKTRQMKVNLTTNGILMDPEDLEGILRSGVWKIILSVQTPPEGFEARGSKTLSSAEYHEKIADILRSFIDLKRKYKEAVLELHYLDTSKFRPGTKLIEEDFEFRQLIEYWKNIVRGISPDIHLSEELMLSQDEGTGRLYEILPGLKLRLKPAISFGNAIQSPDIHKAESERKCYSGHCQFPFNSIAILVNGDMVSCCMDHNGSNLLGNVFRDGGIKKVYEGKTARKFRKQFTMQKIRSERCQKCLGGVFFGAPI